MRRRRHAPQLGRNARQCAVPRQQQTGYQQRQTFCGPHTELRGAGFTPTTGAQVTSTCPPGTVADTRPGSQAAKGSEVVMEISKGSGGGPAQPGQNQGPNGGKRGKGTPAR